MEGVTLCACGCGSLAPIAHDSDKTRGYRAGQPRRYVHGHNRRREGSTGYPGVTRGGPRLVHRLRAERALGKLLPPRAVVHHADGSRSATAPLVILQNAAEHMQIHARLRIYKAGGNPFHDAICPRCSQVLPLSAFNQRQRAYRQRDDYCRECMKARRCP